MTLHPCPHTQNAVSFVVCVFATFIVNPQGTFISNSHASLQQLRIIGHELTPSRPQVL